MSDTPDTQNAQLQLKKRARRRLVGAIALAGLAAVVLPIVMDKQPTQQVQDVQIQIPGQEQVPFNPNPEMPPLLPPAEDSATPTNPATEPTRAASDSVKPANSAVKAPEKTSEKKPEKAAEKKPEKPKENTPDKTPEKAVEKAAEKPPTKRPETTEQDAQRAAAILAGKAAATPPAASAERNGSSYAILIGAFSNPANVKQLQGKIGELGIKVYTEALDTPKGKKTRVRAGPFATKEAADQALAKIKRIGVNGVVAAKR